MSPISEKSISPEMVLELETLLQEGRTSGEARRALQLDGTLENQAAVLGLALLDTQNASQKALEAAAFELEDMRSELNAVRAELARIEASRLWRSIRFLRRALPR